MRISALIKCELVRLKSANCCLKKIWMLFSKLMRFMWEKYELVHLENVTKNNESRNAFWKRFFEKFAFQFTIVHFFLKCCQKFLLRKKLFILFLCIAEKCSSVGFLGRQLQVIMQKCHTLFSFWYLPHYSNRSRSSLWMEKRRWRAGGE